MHKSSSRCESSIKTTSLLRSSLVVGVMTLLSRILGLVRDMVIANYFGASASADAFFVAFRIPNFFRRLFAEGAFSQAFVPVLSDYRMNHPEEMKRLIHHVAGTLGILLIGVSLVGSFAAPWIIWLFAPGFHAHADQLQMAAEMLQITFPYLLLISLTAFSGSVLNSQGFFAVPAFTPVLLNLSLIGAALWLRVYFAIPTMALAWGVLIAGVMQWLFQLPFLWRLGLLPRPVWGWHHPGVRRILTLMLPALFSVSVSQISSLLDTVLASFLPSGSISWLYYSERLSGLPLGLFAVAIATVILPNLSQDHANRSPGEFSHTLDWAVRLIALVGVPSSVALFILAVPLLATLFQSGHMTATDITMSAMSLRAYAVGLLSFMLIKVFATGYFSRQDMKTPVRIGIQCLLANMVLNILLIWPLAHAGLALATGLSATLNAGLLGYGLYRVGVYQPGRLWRRYTLQLLFANGVMGCVLIWLSGSFAQWLSWGSWDKLLHLSGLIVAGLSIYVLALLISGVRFAHFRHQTSLGKREKAS